jgi:DNA polymerase V
MLTIPMALEAVHAGFPSVAQDYFISDFSFDEHVITHPDTSFVVRVAGDSMIGAGIYDGDLIIVDRRLEAKDGDIVIAIIDNELTIKRLRVRKNLPPLLIPENPRYPTIHVEEGAELTIWGVAIGNYHFLQQLSSPAEFGNTFSSAYDNAPNSRFSSTRSSPYIGDICDDTSNSTPSSMHDDMRGRAKGMAT